MNIQQLRLQHGWSQQQLAELSGLSARTIQRIENGQPASAESLKSLASVFGLDYAALAPVQVSSALDSAPHRAPAVAGSDEQRAVSQVRRLRAFYLHVSQYVLVIGLLCAINLVTHPGKLWFLWPAFGWGIGVLAHAAATFRFLPFLGPEWERRQVDKRLGRSS